MQTKDSLNAMIEKSAAPLGVSASIHPEDFIFDFLMTNPSFPNDQSRIDYYFRDGANSAKQFVDIVNRHFGNDIDKIKVLEFASGYGCITRHLKHYSQIELVSSDIHAAANQFNEAVLSVRTLPSVTQPELFLVNELYDACFALSFFSHMPMSTWTRWLVALAETVRVGGVLVFTTHGFTSLQHFPNAEVGPTGFYFEGTSEQKDLPLEEYGNTIVSADFVESVIGTIPQLELLELHEGFWWGHQDLFILEKREAIFRRGTQPIPATQQEVVTSDALLMDSVKVVREPWVSSSYYDVAEGQLDVFWNEETLFRKLFDRLNLESLIELACGHGRHAEQIVDQAGKLVLMDVVDENIKICRDRLNAASNVEYYVNNGFSFAPIEDQSVTAIFCYDAMVHFSADIVENYLKDTKRVLRPGGMALFHHSNYTAEVEQHYGRNPHARNSMSQSRFRQLAESTDLEVVESQIFGWGGVENLDCLTLVKA